MIHFITYGDHNYTTSKQRIKQEALNCGYLDKVYVYGREDLPQDFIQKTEPYISHSRGGGYWMWKGPLLKKTFEMMDDGDYCIYVDCGCTVNPHGMEKLKYYLSLIDDSGSGIFRYKHGGTPEQKHTNYKVLEFYGVENDEDFKNSDILMAGVLIFKKNENSERYINRLIEISENHPYLFSDEFNNYKKSPLNDFHRHDQSVSSCLVKREFPNAVIYQDETYAPDMQGWQDLFLNVKVPFLATRIRG